MRDKFIMGIDPGKNGGIALVNDEEAKVFPLTNLTPRDIADIFFDISHEVKVCYLEKVHSMPLQGVKSSFTFGENYGVLQGILLGFRLRVEHVLPNAWQKALSCQSRGDKNVTKRKAQELFPLMDKMTHAKADALLIAEYGRRKEK